MYKTNITACIKVNGQILRESGDLVTLPFGTEWSLLLKNLNSVRVQVSVSVDGAEATEGTKLIIAPNSSLELERFIKGGNLNAGNKFRFIERTSEVDKHRGVGSDDGLVRVEAWREILAPQVLNVPVVHYYDQWVPRYPHWPYRGPYYGLTNTVNTCGLSGQQVGASGQATNSTANIGSASSGILRGQSVNSSNKMSRSHPEVERSLSDVGITVPGSESRQQFVSVADFPLETQSTVIVLHLRGQVGTVPVVVPVTVKAKPKCSSCGKVNKAGMEFCGKCGTALVVYA